MKSKTFLKTLSSKVFSEHKFVLKYITAKAKLLGNIIHAIPASFSTISALELAYIRCTLRAFNLQNLVIKPNIMTIALAYIPQYCTS